MSALGAILLILGYVLGIGVLVTIGLILLIVGAPFAILGATGHPAGGRSSWW